MILTLHLSMSKSCSSVFQTSVGGWFPKFLAVMQSFILKKEGEPTATLNTPQGRNRQKDPRGLLAIASAKEISVDAPEVASSSFFYQCVMAYAN